MPVLVEVYPNEEDSDIPNKRNLWYQQDGPPSHFSTTSEIIGCFSQSMVWQKGIELPAYSTDLTPFDFFFEAT